MVNRMAAEQVTNLSNNSFNSSIATTFESPDGEAGSVLDAEGVEMDRIGGDADEVELAAVMELDVAELF